jgi:hypothetical protein
MAKKFSYATQTTTPCNNNAYRWYFVNAMNKSKNGATPGIRAYYRLIANYYLNGNIYVLFK